MLLLKGSLPAEKLAVIPGLASSLKEPGRFYFAMRSLLPLPFGERGGDDSREIRLAVWARSASLTLRVSVSSEQVCHLTPSLCPQGRGSYK